jgi:hypothetical protein
MRILVAGMIGGTEMFVWTSIAHMALPLREAGIGEIRNESAVLSAIQSSMGATRPAFIFSRSRVARYAAYRHSAR